MSFICALLPTILNAHNLNVKLQMILLKKEEEKEVDRYLRLTLYF